LIFVADWPQHSGVRPDSQAAQILRIAEQRGLVRSCDVTAAGIPRATLRRMVQAGQLRQVARGVYGLPERHFSRQHPLAEVAARSSRGVFCLLTALRFHGLTTQSPAEVWIALPEKARKPRLDYPRLRIVRFSGKALTEGVETHPVEGVNVRFYSAAKTVADCFKFRNKIGIDVAVEALKDFSRTHRGGANELARFARICRITRVIQPYLDAIA
jgi:predicted transcriptional regulator of viral defense system